MIAAVTSIIGENTTIPTRAPKISTALFIVLFNNPLRGTWRILITGSPCRSSVYGLVGITLL